MSKKKKRSVSPANWIKFLVMGAFLLAGLLQGAIAGKIISRYQPNASFEAVINNPAPKEILPKAIRIPRLGIAAYIDPVELNDQGEMAMPEDPFRVGWYRHGGQPGKEGSVVIGGHLDSTVGPAVFFRLSQVKIGDEIIVYDQEEIEYHYQVIAKESYDEEAFPSEEVFAVNHKKRLNLITCRGIFNRVTKRYSKRIVVYSELKEPENELAPGGN
jgi:LPXTG-site transpeptidase (sortase) family protein